MLVDAVVVAGDRAGADVDAFTDGRVPDVGQVRHLRPAADRRLLQLDEVTNLRLGADVGQRPQMAERAERRRLFDRRLADHAIRQQRDAVGEARRAHLRARADDTFAADRGLPLDRDVRIDRRIRADRDGVLDVRAGRVEDRHAALHQPVEDQSAVDGRDRRELLAIVYAGGFGGIRSDDRFDLRTGPGQNPDDVGQVVLALIVVRAHLVEGGPEPRGGEAIHGGVDLGDLLLRTRGVAL